MIWSIVRAGSAQPASPTMRPGTPATVFFGGTGASTTEPAAIREHWPISILPQHLGARPDENAAADLGMPVAGLLAGAAERNVLEQRDVILDHRRHADHESRGVVEEDALPESGMRVDVGLEHA